MSYLHIHCSTAWPEPSPNGFAEMAREPSAEVRLIVDMSTHPKVYSGSWGVTYDAFCTIGDLEPAEQERRMQMLEVPEDNPEARRR